MLSTALEDSIVASDFPNTYTDMHSVPLKRTAVPSDSNQVKQSETLKQSENL